MNPDKSNLWIILLIVVLAIILVGWYAWRSSQEAPPAAETTPAEEGLGSEIYGEVSSNPVEGEIKTIQPAPNPVEGAYRNPFE